MRLTGFPGSSFSPIPAPFPNFWPMGTQCGDVSSKWDEWTLARAGHVVKRWCERGHFCRRGTGSSADDLCVSHLVPGEGGW